MCFAVYLAADKPLRLVQWNSDQAPFHVRDLQDDEREVNSHFSKEHVVYAGAYEGCGCGFQYWEYGPEHYEPTQWNQGRRSLEEFSMYLRVELANVGALELFACNEGEQAEPPEHHRTLTPAAMGAPGFYFLTKERSSIVDDPCE